MFFGAGECMAQDGNGNRTDIWEGLKLAKIDMTIPPRYAPNSPFALGDVL